MTDLPERPDLYGFAEEWASAPVHYEHAIAKYAVDMLGVIRDGSYTNPERPWSLADEALRNIRNSGWRP